MQCGDERVYRSVMCDEDNCDEQFHTGRGDGGGRTTAQTAPSTVPSHDGTGSTRLLVDERTGRVSDVIVSTEYIPKRDKNVLLSSSPMGRRPMPASSDSINKATEAQKVE